MELLRSFRETQQAGDGFEGSQRTDRRQLLRHSVILAALNNVVKIYGFYLLGF